MPNPPRPKPAKVDAYIAAFEPSVQAVWVQVRALRLAALQALENIGYGMPADSQGGVWVYFAAFQQHIGFYPPVRGDRALEQAAAPYAGPKGNLKFPLSQPMPLALIAALTRWRLQQGAEKHRHARPS